MATLDMDKIENAVMETIATIASLTSGTSIFYGQIPENKLEVVAVVIDANATGNEAEIPKFQVQIIGKYRLRKNAVAAYSKISQGLPLYGDRTVVISGTSSVVIAGILKRGNGGVYQDSDNGTKVWCFSINAIACIKSTT